MLVCRREPLGERCSRLAAKPGLICGAVARMSCDEVLELAQVGVDGIAGERALERVELADLLGSQGFTLAHGRPFSAW